MTGLVLLLVKLVFRRYEFLVVFGQGRVCDRKFGAGAIDVRVGFKFSGCGAIDVRVGFELSGCGGERAKNFNPRRTLFCTKQSNRLTDINCPVL